MSLSLDANVLFDLVNGTSRPLRAHFETVLGAGEALATCSLAAHELVFGAMISTRVEKQLRMAQDLLARLEVTPFDQGDAIAAARLRATLRRRGRSIGSIDALIAGQALARGWTIVTANTHEFARVEGLNVIDWTVLPD